ncbi:MAG: patatin-like phospholipase family protein [Cyclobacteriaceae bacterium]
MSESVDTAKKVVNLNRIALCFSGGGFRAAAYALGVLSFLNKLTSGKGTLLDRVVFIASASGGTITNAYYSLCRVQGKTFDTFYNELLSALQGQKMMLATLETLSDAEQWNSSDSKNRNLVNAFSKMIDQQLFKGATFGQIENNLGSDFSVCFNTAELYRGLTFRFQVDNAADTREMVGNSRIFLNRKQKHYQKIKLADITTASSAFPAGFEPIMFPNDFTYTHSLANQQLTLAELKDSVTINPYGGKRSLFNKPFGLMDGGIRDNQALYSTMEAHKRKAGNFDLIAVNDVASYFVDPYVEPALINKPKLKWLDRSLEDELVKIQTFYNRVGKGLTIGLIGSVIILIASLLLIALTANVTLKFIGVGLGGVGFTVAAACGIFGYLKKTKIDKFIPEGEPLTVLKQYASQASFAKNFSPEVINLIVTYFAKLKIKSLFKMLVAREKSVAMIALDINLKNSRDLTYNLFHQSKRYTDKRLSNLVYELSEYNKDAREFRVTKRLSFLTQADRDLLLLDTEKVRVPAELARTMGTTLWFDNSHTARLKELVACGQFTMCANLLEHLMILKAKKLIDPADAELAVLRNQLETHWVAFKNDPYHMV